MLWLSAPPSCVLSYRPWGLSSANTTYRIRTTAYNCKPSKQSIICNEQGAPRDHHIFAYLFPYGGGSASLGRSPKSRGVAVQISYATFFMKNGSRNSQNAAKVFRLRPTCLSLLTSAPGAAAAAADGRSGPPQPRRCCSALCSQTATPSSACMHLWYVGLKEMLATNLKEYI